MKHERWNTDPDGWWQVVVKPLLYLLVMCVLVFLLARWWAGLAS